MAAECWLQEVIHRQQMLCDHKQEDFCQSHESNCLPRCCCARHRASSRCFYYSRQTFTPAPRREQLAKLKLRLSHSASLITSEGFKVSSTFKASAQYSSSSVFFLLQRLLPCDIWYCSSISNATTTNKAINKSTLYLLMWSHQGICKVY